MTIWRMVVKEMRHGWGNTVLAVVSVSAAVAALAGTLAMLDVHEAATRRLLAQQQEQTRLRMAQLEDDMRRAMKGLGFNILILPAEQSLEQWYAQDSGDSTMPEEYASRLVSSKVVTVQHVLPVLQRRVAWEERKRTIILVGTGREQGGGPSDASRPGTPGAKESMASQVPPGKIVLGHELHNSLGLTVGDRLTLMGREFTVQACQSMRGNKDDISAWFNLKQAQEMLGSPGRINAILALECQCAWADLPEVRKEITRILPQTQVIERGGEALARAEARRRVGEEAQAAMAGERQRRALLYLQRQRLASVLLPLVMAASALGVGVLSAANVRHRRGEIALLRAIGLRGRAILGLFLGKAVLVGLAGGIVGIAAGQLAGTQLGRWLESPGPGGGQGVAWLGLLLAALVGPVLSAAAAWLPALAAVRQDPAIILQQE